MTNLVLDTHSLIRYLEKSPRLTETARAAIKAALGEGKVLYVSAISLAEILYLDEKGRVPTGTLGKVMGEMARPTAGWSKRPLWQAW